MIGLAKVQPEMARFVERQGPTTAPTTEQVGHLATEAQVKTLVFSQFVPGGYPFVPDEVWYQAVQPHFSGRRDGSSVPARGPTRSHNSPEHSRMVVEGGLA